jgi:general secretion pathway protein N
MQATRPPWSVRQIAAVASAALLSALLVLATQAPASLLALAVDSWSRGHVELGDASGTVWHGQAAILLAPGSQPTGATPTRVPGQTAWRIAAWPLLTGALDLTLTNPAVLGTPLALHMDHARNATIEANHIRLPAEILLGLGAPWTTIQPGGELQLEWDNLQLSAGSLHGELRGEWLAASSRLSPIVPLGDFRLVLEGIYPGAQVRLETVSGPIEMTGSGTIADGNRLRFRGSARIQPGTDATVATQLSGLITLLGPRDGDGAVLTIGN